MKRFSLTFAASATFVAAVIAANPGYATESLENNRMADGAIGAIAGGIVAGPIGLIAGALIGYAAGPEITAPVVEPSRKKTAKQTIRRRRFAQNQTVNRYQPVYEAQPQPYQTTPQQYYPWRQPAYPQQIQPGFQPTEDFPVSSLRQNYVRQSYPAQGAPRQAYPGYDQGPRGYVPAPFVQSPGQSQALAQAPAQALSPAQAYAPIPARRQDGQPFNPAQAYPSDQKIYDPRQNPLVPPPTAMGGRINHLAPYQPAAYAPPSAQPQGYPQGYPQTYPQAYGYNPPNRPQQAPTVPPPR